MVYGVVTAIRDEFQLPQHRQVYVTTALCVISFLFGAATDYAGMETSIWMRLMLHFCLPDVISVEVKYVFIPKLCVPSSL